MDYVVGSVAALISGNVTPNRPKLARRALTPIKHQASPNVTPKSELIEDRSIFLSPSVQKKKAIVKKSPKRIFENPDLDGTDSNEGNTSLTSPKAEKVKKHLKSDLDNDTTIGKPKSPKHKLNDSLGSTNSVEVDKNDNQNVNESTPKKKKKKRNSVSNSADNMIVEDIKTDEVAVPSHVSKSPKKIKERHPSVHEENVKENESESVNETKSVSPKKQKVTQNDNNAHENKENPNVQTQKTKNKKRKKKNKPQNNEKKTSNDNIEMNKETVNASSKKKNKKGKKPKIQTPEVEINENHQSDDEDIDNIDPKNSSINPNAVTDKDSDSEHESDNEIESENEEINKKVLDTGEENSSDEEEEEKPPKTEKKEDTEVLTEDDIKRTLFVGNVPFSKKVKKEIKKIFSKHGQIETVRIRTVPIKDGRFTPKMAVIKNELHPDRSTVNVYVKYADSASVELALAENNTVLNDHHLRVSRSDSTGAEHDPRCSVFVGNLPFALEDEALRAKFEGCGDIVSVRIVRDKKTNAGKGFGYVNFASKDGVELALALSEEDLTIKNRILRVKRCVPPGKQKPGPNRFNKKQGSNDSGTNRFNRQQGSNDSGPNRFNRQQGSNDSGPNRFNRNQRPGGPGQNRFNRQVSDGPNKFNRPRQDGPGPNRFNNQRGPNRFDNQRGPNRFNQDGNQRQMNQNRGPRQFGPPKDGNEGAFRRIMNKRPHEASGDGPPNKKPNINQPNKEKKTRKEFVGMTAEKKKKRKFDKGQKKKKVLSEILSK